MHSTPLASHSVQDNSMGERGKCARENELNGSNETDGCEGSEIKNEQMPKYLAVLLLLLLVFGVLRSQGTQARPHCNGGCAW